VYDVYFVTCIYVCIFACVKHCFSFQLVSPEFLCLCGFVKDISDLTGMILSVSFCNNVANFLQ